LLTDWSQPSAGGYHSCAVKSDHTLWCWGKGDSGQLGDGTTVKKNIPVKVGSASDWLAVSAGSYHTCATKGLGELWCFGYNGYGQLGNGTLDGSTVPVRAGSATNWQALSAGHFFTCGLKSDSSLWCWGLNDYGQLGNGDTSTDQASPVQELGGDTHWTKLSAGVTHACAVKSPGTLWCWGGNEYGQLGDGTTADRASPVQELGGDTNWDQVSAGVDFTCARKSAGTLWCWGNNDKGQLGDGVAWKTSPQLVGKP
jgi:alpha-tubulin suppressor-like RCC1 family protein